MTVNNEFCSTNLICNCVMNIILKKLFPKKNKQTGAQNSGIVISFVSYSLATVYLKLTLWLQF